MTDYTATAPSAARRRLRLPVAVRSAAARDTVVVSALALWVAVLAALTWGSWGDITMDTGYDLVAAAKSADGELPYVDYVYFYGPLGPMLLGGIYSMTGPGLAPALALGFVLALAAIGLTYRVARLLVGPLGAGLAAAFTAAAALSGENASYVLPHTLSAPIAIVLLLLVILGLGQHLQGGSRRSLALAGIGIGLIAVTRPEVATWIYPAAAIYLLVRVWRSPESRSGAWRDVLVVAIPAGLIPAVIYGAFLTSVPLGDLLWENLYSKDYFAAAGSVLTEGWAPYTFGSFVDLGERVVVYAAVAAGLYAAAWAIEAGGLLRVLAIAAGAIGLFGLLAVLAVRPETLRHYLAYAYAWIPAGAWLAALALLWRSKRIGSARERQVSLLVVLLLGVVAFSAYGSFRPFPNPLHPDKTPYIAALVAIFLAWAHVRVIPRGRFVAQSVGLAWLAALVLANTGLALHDARQESSTFGGPGGTLNARSAEGPVLQQAMDVIARETRAGDPILIAPRLTALYAMADRTNPLPQLSLLPGMLPTAAEERQAIARMSDVDLVVIDRTPLTLFGLGQFGEGYAKEIGAWLERDFRLIASIDGSGKELTGIDVYKRQRSE
jgi:4-amino-4-deoxy-L-arabinose transferase-like glycosyltransferase